MLDIVPTIYINLESDVEKEFELDPNSKLNLIDTYPQIRYNEDSWSDRYYQIHFGSSEESVITK